MMFIVYFVKKLLLCYSSLLEHISVGNYLDHVFLNLYDYLTPVFPEEKCVHIQYTCLDINLLPILTMTEQFLSQWTKHSYFVSPYISTTTISKV